MGRETVFHFLIFVHLKSFLFGLSVEIDGFSQAKHSCPLCWRKISYQVVKCGVILHVERIVWREASWRELLEGQCGRNTRSWRFLHWSHSSLHLIFFFLHSSQLNFSKDSSTYTTSFSSTPIHASNHPNLSSSFSTTLKLLLLRQPTPCWQIKGTLFCPYII